MANAMVNFKQAGSSIEVAFNQGRSIFINKGRLGAPLINAIVNGYMNAKYTLNLNVYLDDNDIKTSFYQGASIWYNKGQEGCDLVNAIVDGYENAKSNYYDKN